MSAPGGGQDGEGGSIPETTRATGVRHLALGFALMITILFTAALCSLPS